MSFDEDWLRRSRSEQQVELEATWIYQIDPVRREVVNTRIAQGLIPILEIDGGYEVKWLGRLNRIHGRGESRRSLLEAFDLSVQNIQFRIDQNSK